MDLLHYTDNKYKLITGSKPEFEAQAIQRVLELTCLLQNIFY